MKGRGTQGQIRGDLTGKLQSVWSMERRGLIWTMSAKVTLAPVRVGRVPHPSRQAGDGVVKSVSVGFLLRLCSWLWCEV